jgi:hypothetical protein
MECEVKDCKRESKTVKYGNLCLMHYKRKNRTGTTDKNTELSDNRAKRESEKCKYCDRKVGRSGAKGMCNKHYQMERLHNDPLYRDKTKGMPGSSGYIRHNYGKGLHRTIMEDNIGRLLESSEIVHHINCIKTDNRIENLYLCKNQSEHQKLHQQLNRIQKQFMEDGIIIFENGEYRTKSK